jgi:hypothetical protein
MAEASFRMSSAGNPKHSSSAYTAKRTHSQTLPNLLTFACTQKHAQSHFVFEGLTVASAMSSEGVVGGSSSDGSIWGDGDFPQEAAPQKLRRTETS